MQKSKLTLYVDKKTSTMAHNTAGMLADRVLDDFDVSPLSADILRQSRTLPEKDLEDMIQYFSALHQGCEVLVTRNKEDFPVAGLKVLTPAEFLEAVAEL